MTPDVAVLIPTRNRWPWLERALSNALAQTGVTVEVVVVDDASSDGSRERLEQLGDARVRVTANEHRLGPAGARNAGLRVCEAPWIALLDDDDRWAPDKLATQLAAAKSAGADFVYGAAVAVDAGGEIVATYVAPSPSELLPALLSTNAMPAGCSNVVATAALLRSVGAFDESLSHTYDWDMWIRLAAAGRPAACSEVLTAYTIHEGNRIGLDADAARHDLDRLITKHAQLSQVHGVPFDRVDFSRWVGAGLRRAGRRRAAAHWYLVTALELRNPGNLARAGLAAVPGLWRRPSRAQSRPAWL